MTKGKKEENEMSEELLCCDECGGGYGWVWHSGDLGNSHRVGGVSYKAGRMWAQVCPNWKEEDNPPPPPGISDMSPYIKELKTDGKGKRSSKGFH
mgnify:CR=1 FL=1